MESELFMLFKDGRRKALTFSYDDGTIHDRRLVSLMNQYGMKGTFNLNSGLLGREGHQIIDGKDMDYSRIREEEVKTLYAGHEVASHTLTHPSLTSLPSNMGAAEVLKDRHNLETLTGELVRGFAYPYGTYNEQVKEILEACGIEYARTVRSTETFEPPQDLLEWHPTCHHDSPRLLELLRKFCKEKAQSPEIFYLWGHSYEFSQKDNWQIIEDFMKYASSYQEEIWFAANIEIADYIGALKKLMRSTDGRIIYNPSGITLWFEMNREVHCIHSNEKYGPL